MRKMKIFVVVCAVFLTLLNVHKSDGQESPSSNVLNIIVILDTSDRTRHPGQIERDIKVVRDIVTEFEKVVRGHIDNSDNLEYKDSLAVVVPDQPSVPPPWEITEKLTVEDPGGHNSLHGSSGIFTDLEKQKKALLDKMPTLYEFVEPHRQTGSDIWEWFQSEAQHYLSKGQPNLIICLSDGYLNFDKNIEEGRREGTYMKVRELRSDPDWREKIHGSEGLLRVGDFSPYNVKFLMLEIKLQSERNSGIPYQQDFEIIKEYWKTWLNSMGIRARDSDFIKHGRPVTRKIRSFISGGG